ncbi:MAG: elongation factor G, partial [Pseudomonadota bacterium]
VLAAPYLRAAEEAGTPCMILINRLDEPKGRIRDVVSSLQEFANHPLILRQVPIRDGEKVVGAVDLISERAWQYRDGQPSALVQMPDSVANREHEARGELLEQLSEVDDWLLEELIEDRSPDSTALYSIASKVLQSTQLIPVFLGSAEHNNGIRRLMKALRHEAPDADALRERLAQHTHTTSDRSASAVAFHADQRQHAGKVVFLRALGNQVRQGQSLCGSNLGPLLQVGGENTTTKNELATGSIGLAVKSDFLKVGQLVTAGEATDLRAVSRPTPPMMSRQLIAKTETDESRLTTVLGLLAEEDPGMTVTRDENSGHPIVQVQGPMHLRRLHERLKSTFGLQVAEATVEANYRETPARPATVHYRHRKQTGGSGQFADVVMTITPANRGEGFGFNETVKGGTVPAKFIPAVEAGAREATASGPRGFPVVDVHVTLTDGKHHSVDSNEFAFRAAGRMGVREGFEQAGSVLLQPIESVTIHVPSPFCGDLVSLISTLHGQVLGFDRNPNARGWDVFRALLPQSAHDSLATSLRAATQGTAYFETEFDHFEEVYGKEAERIVQERETSQATSHH